MPPGTSSMQRNMERGSGSRMTGRVGAGENPKKKTNYKKVLPEIWKLVRPRRWLLLLGLVLVLIKSAASLVMPFTTRLLVDRVLVPHNSGLLVPLVAVVFTATAIQAACTYVLTQSLSKEAQKLITEL